MFQSQHKFAKQLVSFCLFGVLITLFAACRPQAAVALPTAIPTLTTVPRSTPLPAIPTSVPVGQSDNPLRLVIYPVAELASDKSATKDIEAAIEKKTGLTVKFDIVSSNAEALTALCTASANEPAIAWLNGMGFVVAHAKKCGQPQLLVSRGSGKDKTTGVISTVIARRGIDSLSSLKGRTFCRISSTDLVSWLIPSLLMQATGMNAESDLKLIKDYVEPADLVKAVSTSECDAAAIPDSLVKELLTDDKTIAAKVSTLISSVEFPYSVMVASSDVPLTVLASLNDELIAISQDKALKSSLGKLLDQSGFVQVTVDDLQPLLDFASSTKQDFAQLGS